MEIFAGSLHLLSALAFVGVCLTVGGRMIALWRRTRQLPELLLGGGVGLAGGLGYGILMTAVILATAQQDPARYVPLAIVGYTFHHVGVVLITAFVVVVFRRESRWAWALWAFLALVLWAGFGFYLASGNMARQQLGWSYWLMFSVIGSYPIWGALESLRYYRRMRRRERVGLADRLIANRFLCWGVAEVCTLAAIWFANVPAVLGTQAQAPPAWSMLATAFFGTTAVLAYAFTFFPPAWYRARFAAAAPPA